MRFSRRTPSDLMENAIARSLASRTRPYLDLTESNPSRAGLSPSESELRAALAGSEISAYAPDPRGIRPAREAVRNYYRIRGVEAEVADLFLTASTSEAYSFLFKLLCDPGDSILVPEPSYPLFDHLANLDGVRQIPYRLEFQSRWVIDPGSIEEGLKAGARIVILVSPNNPTGNITTDKEFESIRDLADRHGAALISDEVFLDYPLEFPARRAPVAASRAASTLTFSLGGLSKSCALPQMKLAWILAAGPAKELVEVRLRLDLIADTYLSVSAPVQSALAEIFPAGERAASRIRERLRGNLTALDAMIAAQAQRGGVTRLPVEGGWSAVLRVPAIRSEESIVLALLENHGVLVAPGWFFNFPFEGVLVLSLLPEPGVFREALGRLSDFLASS